MKVSKSNLEEFPVDNVARTNEITVIVNPDMTIKIPYKDLELVMVHGQLCFKYEKDDICLYMPIARKSAIMSIL